MSNAIVLSPGYPQVVVIDQPMSAPVVLSDGGSPVVLPVESQTVVITQALQGLPGPPGRDGAEVAGALKEANRLSEFSQDPQAQRDAQQNLGLGHVDPLAYYILAKS